MKAQDQDGREAEIADDGGRPARKPARKPRGPLPSDQVTSLQETIAQGMIANGYNQRHVGQVLNQPKRTASRRANPGQGRPPGI